MAAGAGGTCGGSVERGAALAVPEVPDFVALVKSESRGTGGMLGAAGLGVAGVALAGAGAGSADGGVEVDGGVGSRSALTAPGI